MEQYTIFQPKNILSVTQLTHYLREVLEQDEVLQDLWVEGEISNFARPSSGHIYFTLKDGNAAVRCVMWRSAATRLSFSLRDGMAVEAHGSMSVYEVSGQVQLYVDTLKPAGEGALYQEYLRLKSRLEAEGLFDPDKKQPIPSMPHTIGIVTSPTGAALQDMLDTLRRRFPVASIMIAPTAVQGTDAPAGIVAALQHLTAEIHPDVILLGRGGGSIEDLWAFNDEAVVRAVAASPIPIISGVGHETDFTLTDFAADLRAPTPTAAAEVAVPDQVELMVAILETANRHESIMKEIVSELRWQLNQSQNTLVHLSPAHKVNTFRQSLDEIRFRLNRSVKTKLEKKQLQLENLQQSLRSLNPTAVLNRGYAIVSREKDDSLIKNAGEVQPDEKINIKVSQGSLAARVTRINQENEYDHPTTQ